MLSQLKRSAFSACCKSGLAVLFLAALVVALAPSSAMAQQPTNFGSASGVSCPGGNVICNGSVNFLTTELFFEPETPAETLKNAPPTWNELEQLLDNPYLYTWGAACNDPAGPIPGNEAGYPTYCTTSPTAVNNPGGFIRRPNFSGGLSPLVPLPPMLVHPLNYNPQSGAASEMRLLNPNFAGVSNFLASGSVPDITDPNRKPSSTGACYIVTTFTNVPGFDAQVGANECTPMTVRVPVSSGASRGLNVGTALAPGDTEISHNSAVGRKLGVCQQNPEPVPLVGTYQSTSTAFDSENLNTCGSDPGEPGAASTAHNNTFLALCVTEILGPASSLAGYLCEDNIGLPRIGQSTASWYSIPAVPAPNILAGALMQIPNDGSTNPATGNAASIGTGTILNPGAGFRLVDPARGGVIQPLSIASGIGGLHKPSLRKQEFGGTGTNPNYLWNSAASLAARAVPGGDPTGADQLQPSNENDYVGLFGPGVGGANAVFLQRKQQARLEAMALGKAFFWDAQMGSDGVQNCGGCHAHSGVDNRTKNQINPHGQDGIRGNPTNFTKEFDPFPPNHQLTVADFPLHKLKDPEIAGDPVCNPAIQANVAGISFPDGDLPDHPKNPSTFTVCDAANIISDTQEVVSNMGVHFGKFYDIPAGTGTGLTLTNTPGAPPVSPFGPPSAVGHVRALIRDQRAPLAPGCVAGTACDLNVDPFPGFAGAAICDPLTSPTACPAGSLPPTDPLAGHQFRRADPRNVANTILAGINFDTLWDGRGKHDNNTGSASGPADPQAHVFVDQGTGLTATRQLIKFSSFATVWNDAVISKFVASFDGRNLAKVGKKFFQPGVTPLANQLVDPTDSILGRYSNQSGSACAALPAADRSPEGGPPTALGTGVPGLCITYQALIRNAYYPPLYSNTTQHLNGCYTDAFAGDGKPLNPVFVALHPNQCGTGTYPAASIEVLDPDGVVRAHNNDPFDKYVLNLASGPADPADTNQFTQMEANFALYAGNAINVWVSVLVPDDSPDDQFLDANPDTGASTGETGEPLLVLDIPSCTNVPAGYNRGYFISPTNVLLQYRGSCFKEVGDFKRDVYDANDLVFFQNDTAGHPRITACIDQNTVAGTRFCTNRVPAGGTRQPTDPDPLLGFDLFFGANMSLKNPNFRSARCGACHNAPALTDNTFSFTVKGTELDNFKEFEKNNPFVEPLVEPLLRERVISGFLLESEINEPGQDAIERKAPNLGIAPAPVVNNNGNCPTDNCSGYAYPDAITYDPASNSASCLTGQAFSSGVGTYCIHNDLGSGPVAGPGVPVPFTGFGGTFLDNGVYNIGVRPCVADETHPIAACEDTGRGNKDPFGWPLSLTTLMLKNLGGPAQQPGVPIAQFDPNNNNAAGRADALACAPICSTGGLLELTAQDQHINSGYSDVPADPQLPPYLAPFANRVPVGDTHPQADEGCGPVGGCYNTLMDVANEEGFPEVPFDPRAHASEVLNGSVAPGDAGANLVGAGCLVGTGTAPCTSGVTAPLTMIGTTQMGTWPIVNRVHRFGSFKAPQLREVELTGPYFHNGGKLTIRQVVDFYVRGGDFPVTNANHRDFNIMNLNAELQSDMSEEEKVGLVDYLLTFTDDRVALERAPFDHPQEIIPLDGTAPELGQTLADGITMLNRDVMLGGGCVASPLGPGQQECDPALSSDGTLQPMFLSIPATGAAGTIGLGFNAVTGRLPNFLNIAGVAPDALHPAGRQRLVGAAANCAVITSQYCH